MVIFRICLEEQLLMMTLILLKIDIRGLVLMVYKFFNKKSSGSGVKSEIMPSQQFLEELNQPIFRKFEKRKTYSFSKDNI